MIRAFRALAWLRWRLVRNAFKDRGGRGLGERLSRIAHILLPIVIPLLILPTALGLGVLGFVIGTIIGKGGFQPEPGRLFAVRVLVAVATGIVVLLPIARARSAGKTLTRMLLLPIPRRMLHLADVVAGLADPWLLVLLPAVLLLPVGIGVTGSLTDAAVMGAAGIGLIATVAALASAVSQAVQLLLRDRRRAERLILVGGISIALLSFLPAFFLQDGGRRERAREEQRDASGSGESEENTGPNLSLPGFLPILPSELYVQQMEQSAGATAALPWATSGLFLQALLAFGLSANLHRRLLEHPESTSRSRRGERRQVRIFRLPGVTPQASAVAAAQGRTFLRTVKGKMAVFLGPVMGVLLGIWLFHQLELPDLPGGQVPPFTLLAGMICMLSLQPVVLNLFATDGAGLTLQFLGPISDRDMVQGKLMATGFLAAVPTLISGLVAWGIFRKGSVLLWVAALLAAAAAYLLFAPIAAILSILLPRAANLNSMGKDGNPHAAAGFAGIFVVGMCNSPPILLAVFGILVLDSPLAAVGMVTAWMVLAAGIGHVLAGVAAGLLAKRRENLALVAQGR